MREAKRSSFGAGGDNYSCAYPWPQGWYLQCGDRGIVIVLDTSASGPGVRTTAFFEALAEGVFFRGEGSTVDMAEVDAWGQHMLVENCPGHEYERGDYRNGYGTCRHCRDIAKVFEPLDRCIICGKPTYFTQDTDGNWYCGGHSADIPEEKLTWAQRMLRTVEGYWEDLADLAGRAPEEAARQLERDLHSALNHLVGGGAET